MDDEVLGELLGDDLLGYDDDLVGAPIKANIAKAAMAAMRKRPMLRLQPKPAWRNLAVAPGVVAPSQGLEPLPLTPNANNGIFTNVVTAIEFAARPQAPFRPERLLVRVARTGAAGIIILGQIFVGRMLQQVQRGEFDVEFYGPTAFGVRLNLAPATPGMDIAIPCRPSAAIAAGESVAVSMQFLGRTIRG